jgi:hypothetical protein
VVGDVDDEGLIVDDEPVGRPGPAGEGFVEWHAVLEPGAAVDLPGDEHTVVERERRLSPLDDVEAAVEEGPSAQ